MQCKAVEFGTITTCYRSEDSWSAGEEDNTSEEAFLSEHGKWAWRLKQDIKATQQQDSGVEMQIFKDYSNLGSVPSNLQEHHIDEISDKDETESNNSTSAAIPVPTRSLSRQSSRNCATPSSDNANSVKETTFLFGENENTDDITQQIGKETCGVDPCFSPIMTPRRDSPDMKDLESTTANSFDVSRLNSSHKLNSRDVRQTSFPIYQHNTSITGLRSATVCSASQKSKMTFNSPTSSGYGTLSSSISCPTIFSPLPFPCVQEKRQSFPKAPGFQSQGPPKSLQSVHNDSSSYLERFGERAFEPLCRSDPQRRHREENNKENCKNCCINRLKTLSKSDSEHSCCKHCWDFRDASLDRSSVKTCDASTSPHLPLDKIWKCEASSLEQCAINPVIADKPDGPDKRKVLTPADYQYDAFLDYNIQDQAWAVELVNILEGPKYKFRIYMYDRDRVLGRPIIPDIATQIQNSFKYICLLSPRFLSTPVMYNLNMAQQERVTKRPFSNFVILLKIAPCEVPLSLASLEWEDCLTCKDGPNRYVAEKVVRAIRDVT